MPENAVREKNNVTCPAQAPPVTEHFFRRPAVASMLRSAFKKPLTTVIAGAGYGKTQAVLSALMEMECASAWLQLSELNNFASRFWERLAGALRPWSQNLHAGMTTLGYPEAIASFDQFLRLLEKELPQKKPFVLILDDFHLIQNRSILNFIELFISARVQNFSIVLISRKKPDISLVGMLSKGLLARITEDDLRFSREDTGAYLRMRGIELRESMVSSIYAYTDGWIFAIYLVGLTAKKENMQNPIFPVRIDIFDIIEKEIFAAASKGLQDLLIKATMLNVMPSGLINKLAGNDPSLVSEMIQMSTFIRYDPSSDSYRIHQLLKEFLREKRCRLAEPDTYATHLAAAEWYSENGEITEAIYHYKEIGRFNEVFKQIIAIPGRVHHEAADAVVRLISDAPQDMIAAMPVIRVAKAGYLFNNNKFNEAKQELSQLREEFEAQPKTKGNKAVLGEVYLLQGVISMVTSDYAFEELFKKADAYLPGGSKLVDHRTGLADGVNVCSINTPAAGELQRHQDALFRAAPYMARVMNGSGYGLEYLNAAESSLYTGDWKSAEKYAFEAIYRSRQYMQYDIEYMANFVLVRIFTAKGNYEKANEVLAQMAKQLETPQHADCAALYDMISGWFHVKLGKTDRVAKWIKHEEEARELLAPVVIGREYLVRTDCLMVEERYYELLAFMEQTDKVYEERGILFAIIQNKITKAIVHHYLGDRDESIRALNEAYKLSDPNNLIVQYIEYGNRMRTLIHSAKLNKSCTIPRAWLDKIYTKSSSYAKMLSQLVSAYETGHAMDERNLINLSKRESEVLSHLYGGMTRKEIAASCYISLSTVNTILKNIYDKLGAVNAADAIRIAKEKGLI